MLFSSISFLFFFLPCLILCYFLIPKKARNYGIDSTPIYMQSGFKLDMIRGKGVTSVGARTGEALTQELKNKNVPQSVQPFSYGGKDIYGVGSGAGYTETSNGSYAEYGLCFLVRKKIRITS